MLSRLRGALTLAKALGALVVLGGAAAAGVLFLAGDDAEPQSPWLDATPLEQAPVVVVLCHGSNQTWPANLDASYFEAQFSETTGSLTVADYWRDISHGQFSIDGSLVVDVQLDLPRDEIGDRDDDDWQKCRDGLDDQHDIDWEAYAGAVVFKPQTLGRTMHAVSATDTEIRVRTEGHSVAADWPSPPFTAVITTTGSLWANGSTVFENVQVTDLTIDSGNTATFTVERGHTGGYRDRETTATAFAADTRIVDVSEIVGSTGQLSISAHAAPSIINHEFGHFLGWKHSRKRSTATADYGDCFDIMSAMTCRDSHYFTMSTAYAGRDVELVHGLGMTSLYLDNRGWIRDDERAEVDCGTASHDLRALGVPGDGVYQIRVPMNGPIVDGVDAEYLAVELRSQQFAWDQGIPADAVVLHLLGDDGYAYLVDDADAGGVSGLGAGERYEIEGWTVVVEAIDTAAGTARVTIAEPEFLAGDTCVSGGSSPEPPSSDSTEPTTSTTAPTTTMAPPSTTSSTPDVLSGSACVPGSWVLDSQEFIEALAAMSGAPGSGIEHAGGPYTITIDEDGSYQARRDGWAFRFASPEGTFEVVFDSDEAGTMSWADDGTMTFVESDSTSVTDLTVRIEAGGEFVTFPMSAAPASMLAQMPEPELMAGSGTYTCEGDRLQLVADSTAIAANWTRTG